MLLHDVIMTSYYCQRYAECLATTLCSSRTVHRHTAPRTCISWIAAASKTPNFLQVDCAKPVASKQPRSQSYGDLDCHRVYRRQIHSLFLFLVSHFNFLFVPCGGLSWLPVSFLLHVKYTLSYRMNWNGSWSTSAAVLNSRFLTRLLTSGEKDIERVSVLKEVISSTVFNWKCSFCPYLCHSMWLVWLLHL